MYPDGTYFCHGNENSGNDCGNDGFGEAVISTIIYVLFVGVTQIYTV